MATKVKKQTDPNNALSDATELMLDFQNNIKALLDNPVQQGVYMNINAKISGMIAQLNHLNGRAPQHQPVEQFPPVTDFMGEKLELPKQLTSDELSPTEESRQRYVGRVKQLEAEFVSLDDNGIMNGYTTQEDQSILRGVAKRAGVEGFEDRPIDVRFIQDIRTGMEVNRVSAATEADIQRQLASTGTTVPAGPNSATNLTNPASVDNVAAAVGVSGNVVTDADGSPLGEFANVNTAIQPGAEVHPEGNNPGK